ncbi:LysR family transcriptional regulator [Halomonas elongata]|uniref:LysR substrate-binding domain-containing protein n=1 Tax=Halomonas elongata (strain ATCC 33173 / DSM 2581 / NBRC 15536 / NCIMB 2198 / 1H9) TaxID=768066 RepID=A0ABZ0T535_HALED|nr:LysR family transcriptional regulator [Halomonas elongata]MDL4863706.1 LysR substrate-binding domain-containing protein [Halomonas elongata]WBF16990.1 LysR substrate-binding domain-containing protein [Halomonas elongata]WPU45821.1 LysR substrate-binding domain-containing protein [Halomonas elongata DSM 2581]WVI70643.1 LysR substrate-binding domain-containing protein [Halomonas elongata]
MMIWHNSLLISDAGAATMHDADELVAFADVMDSGSLTLSARRLGVAKSTLSRRLQQLESRLGQPLMRRQSNRLLPTEAGRVFHDYCLRILDLADQGHKALEELREEISGELTLEVHDALGRSWIALAIETFMQRHPGVHVSLMIRENLPERLDPQSVVVWFGETGEVGLRQEPLALLSCGLYAHPEYLARHGRPTHPHELERHDWIDLLGEAEHGLVLRHPHHGQVDIRPPGSRLRVNRLVLQSDAIARGQGLGVMPNWMAERRNAAHPGQLERCLPDWQIPPTPVNLLYAHGHQPRKISALLDFLRGARPAEWQHSTQRHAS